MGDGAVIQVDQRLGQAEVHQLDDPLASQHHVARLDVAVQEIALVDVLQGGGDLSNDRPDVFLGNGQLLVGEVVQPRAVDEFHYQQVRPVGGKPTEQSGDVRVLERLDDVGLLTKARQRGDVVDQTVAHHLQGHAPVLRRFTSFVDDGHASSSHTLKDLVALEDLSAEDVPFRAAETIGDQVGQDDAQLGMFSGQSVELVRRQRQSVHGLARDDVRSAALPGDQRHLPDDLAVFQLADHPDDSTLIVGGDANRSA